MSHKAALGQHIPIQNIVHATHHTQMLTRPNEANCAAHRWSKDSTDLHLLLRAFSWPSSALLLTLRTWNWSKLQQWGSKPPNITSYMMCTNPDHSASCFFETRPTMQSRSSPSIKNDLPLVFSYLGYLAVDKTGQLTCIQTL
jgi:hypothetical protein